MEPSLALAVALLPSFLCAQETAPGAQIILVRQPSSASLDLLHEHLRRRGTLLREVSSAETFAPEQIEGAALVVVERSVDTPWASSAREALFERVAGGLHVALWQVDAAGWSSDFLPAPIEVTAEAGALTLPARIEHPLARALPPGNWLRRAWAGAARPLAPAWSIVVESERGAQILELARGAGRVALLQVGEGFAGHPAWAGAAADGLLDWCGLRPRARGEPAEGILLEAEDLRGAWRLQQNLPGYLGRGFRTSNRPLVERARLEGSFELERAGDWEVWLRAYEGDGQDRRASLAVDGRAFEPTHAHAWRGEYTWQLAGIARLEAGAHALEIADAGEGFESVDAVRIQPAGARSPAELWLGPAVPRGLHSGRWPALEPVLRRLASLHRAREPFANAEEEAAARLRLRRRLALDPWPERAPLNARAHGSSVHNGVRVERLSFESRPGFVVTANVYVPLEGTPPFPAVAGPTGHWTHAKEESVVQARGFALARAGFVMLIYDPAGQGERAVPGNDHDGSYFAGIPAGRCNLTYMVWDTMRAIDYLQSRPDVDPERIACTGESGGGLNTMYASAVDERIRASVPVVYACNYEQFLETGIGHCPCNHVPGVAEDFDHPELLALCAPRPVLAIAALGDDLFPIEGARKAFAGAKAAFERLGAAGGPEYFETGGPHDYNRDMRVAMIDFLSRHLRGGARVDREGDLELLPPGHADLRVFAQGLPAEGRRTMRSMNDEAVREALAAGSGWTREALARSLERGASEPASAPWARRQGGETRGGERWMVCGETPMLVFRARAEARRGWALVVDSSSGIRGSLETGVARRLVGRGISCALVDPVGMGEFELDEHVHATDWILLGRTASGEQARGILDAVGALGAGELAGGARIAVWARGVDAGLAAALAAGAEPRIARVVADALPRELPGYEDQIRPTQACSWPYAAGVGTFASLLALSGGRVVHGGTDAREDRPPLTEEQAVAWIEEALR